MRAHRGLLPCESALGGNTVLLGASCTSSHFPDYFILLRTVFATALGHRELTAKETPLFVVIYY